MGDDVIYEASYEKFDKLAIAALAIENDPRRQIQMNLDWNEQRVSSANTK